MYWHYQIFKCIPKEGVPYYCIKEIYKNLEGRGKHGWSAGPQTPIGESKDELITILEMMLHDAKKHRTKVERVEE